MTNAREPKHLTVDPGRLPAYSATEMAALLWFTEEEFRAVLQREQRDADRLAERRRIVHAWRADRRGVWARRS